jgi:endoglucanase
MILGGLMRWLAIVLTTVFVVNAQTDYKQLHNLLIKFYGFQRAGDKAKDIKNPFYTKTPAPHSQDGGSTDLSGGWYDAGDFVKFGLPFGFTTYCLLKGYDVFPRAYDDLDSWDYKGAADQIPDILGEVKVATDYMIKAVISSTSMVTDVGNGTQDHQALSEDGYANSSRTSPRQATTGTGADVAGLNAASLALMSTLYKKYDSAYSAKCLAKAKEAYTFGKANQKFSTQQNNGEFYKANSWEDKMAAAAIELYRATKTESYLTDAKAFIAKVGSHYFVLGYADCGDLAYFEIKRQTGESVEGPWLTDVAFTMNRKVIAASASALIKGAFINSDWGNAGKAGSAAFSAGLAFTITGDSKYLDFARSQVHWVAGLAPSTQSYVVGFGNGPTAPHHRNDNTIGKSSGPRLKGGVVSGPSPSGTFDPAKPEAANWSFNGSDVNNYKNTEVALDYNAGMVGAVAFLRDYDNPPAGMIRITEALKVAPGNVDLNTAPAAITATFEATQSWKLILTGRTSKATKTFSGSGKAISLSWKGEVETGAFQVGEQIDVVIDMANIASYHEIRARTSFFLIGALKEDFKATDILVDDFEDGDALNSQKATWAIFNDKYAGGTSYTNPAAIASSIIAKEGEGATKGISIRLIASAGPKRPMVGIKSPFNATGTAVSLGKASGLVFDIKAAVGDSLRVELEQGDITDSAYNGKTIQFASDAWMRVRIPFSTLTQPDWKTAAKPVNTGNAISVRFTKYGEGNVRFNLDNFRIENLEIGGAPIRVGSSNAKAPKKFLSQGHSYYFVPPAEANWTLEVTDLFGRVLGKKGLGKIGLSTWIDLKGMNLSPGLYFLRHTASDYRGDSIQRIRIESNQGAR